MESFIICTRQSRKKNARKNDCYFYAWYRDPSNGAKLPKNRVDIDTLNHRLKGGIRYHVSSKAEAYRIAQDALDKGLVFGYQKKEKPLLLPYIHGFWDYDSSHYVKRKLIEGSKITKNYTVKMLQTFDKHCKDLIPNGLALDSFTVSMMEKIKVSMFDKKLSSSTINRAIESIKTPLTEAFRLELISENIGERLKVVKRTDKEKGIMTAAEAQNLIKYLKQHTDPQGYERWRYLTVALIYYTGMRNSEIQALFPSCIELRVDGKCFIHVKHGYNKIDGLKATKNGKERTVTAPIELGKELLAYSEGNPNGFIFYSLSDRDKPLNEKQITGNFIDAMKAIGISEEQQKERGLSFYSFRHFFNTALIDSGLSELEIRNVTGHSSLAMTEHYSHENEQRLLKQAEARAKAIPYI